jgi:Phosphotransferase enzyme family
MEPRTTRRSGGSSVAETVGLAARVGSELIRLGRGRFARSHPIPPSVGDLDERFLTSLLGRSVTSFEVVDETRGTTNRARVALQGDGLPPSVFVKMAAVAPVTRLFGNLADLGSDEVGFYRDVRSNVPIEAPTVLGLTYDRSTKRFAIVLEDLGARGCSFADVLNPLDLGQATAVLETLAGLHGSQWRNPRLDVSGGAGGLAWIRANGSDPLLPLVARVMQSLGRRLGKADASLVPMEGRRILLHYRSIAAVLDAGPHTILHGDPHPGNCYFTDGHAGLLDWQVVRRGNPLRDVTYFLVLALDAPTRRGHERDLLDHYRDSLAAAGGPSLTADEAWMTYRRMAAYPYAAATFTAALGGLQDAPIAKEGLRRAVTAIGDLDTVETLGLPA